MRKLLYILIGLIIITFIGCTQNIIGDENTIEVNQNTDYTKCIIGDEKTAEDFVKSQGYTIITRKGEIQKYTLEKSKLYGGTGTIPYQQVWGVQTVEPEKYFGKEIVVYGFTVKNHPLEKKHQESEGAIVYIMISEGNVIGGYSSVTNVDDIVGEGYYSIDGKTLEEVTGLSYKQWSEEWKKKYKN